jgi:TRAP-type mannitol/chloroaromatic compound transport system permease small subunit
MPDRLLKFIDQMSEYVGKATSWLAIILVLIVCYDVVTRYIFNISSVAVQELEWHIFAVMFLLGATYTLKNDNHVRVDIFYSRLTPKNKAIVNLVGVFVFLVPFCIIILITSFYFVLNSFNVLESSPDPGGLPARYILKSILPISFFLLLLQGISLGLKSSIEIFSAEREGN